MGGPSVTTNYTDDEPNSSITSEQLKVLPYSMDRKPEFANVMTNGPSMNFKDAGIPNEHPQPKTALEQPRKFQYPGGP